MKRYISALIFTIALLAVYDSAWASSACFRNFNSGSGANLFNFCVSNHGNLLNLTSPSGTGDHINSEGYVICGDLGLEGYDAGSVELGCGASTVSGTSLPLTITRTCDCIRFKQVFSRDTVEKDITITMTLTNVCSFNLPDVSLHRYFDGDINGDSSDDIYDHTSHSVSGRDTSPGNVNVNRVTLTALTSATSHSALVETFADWSPSTNGTATQCGASPQGGTPTPQGDFVGRIFYFLNDLNPNQSKTVKVLYRRD